MRVIIACIALVILAGCSQKDGIFEQNSQKSSAYFKNLQNVKILKIMENKYVKATVWVAYLNETQLLKYNKADENFLVSVYYSDPKDAKEYHFTLNGQKAKSSQKLSSKELEKIDLALYNKWAQYYHLTFDKQKKETLKLQFQEKDSKESLTFRYP